MRTVVIADDQTVVREGLRSMLSMLPGIEVLGLAATAEFALELIEATDPDVLLTDLRMPGMGGIAGIRQLIASGSRTRAVALTTYDDDATILEALGAGAVGFLNKDAAAQTIAAAIDAAADGRSLLDARAMAALLGQQTVARTVDNTGLTSREIDVIRLIARGLSNQQIARELVLGISTIKTHINHILTKTSCRDRSAVVSYAYENGLV